VQTRLRLGQYDAAKAAAAEFRDIFGKDNFYAEVMDHGIDIERRTMNDLMRLAKELDLPARRHERPALHAPARREEPRRPAVRPVGLDAR
jgi:DNA polymerase III alpha subunit